MASRNGLWTVKQALAALSALYHIIKELNSNSVNFNVINRISQLKHMSNENYASLAMNWIWVEMCLQIVINWPGGHF